MDPYKVIHATPSVSVYRGLRVKSGLDAKSEAAAIAGLPNSLFSVQIILESNSNGGSITVVGMGRVIGDGGCFYQVVDIAVDPAHQGKGLGKLVMKEIKKWLDENVPESGYVSLIADGQAKNLYRQFGFIETAPASVGMARFYEEGMERI